MPAHDVSQLPAQQATGLALLDDQFRVLWCNDALTDTVQAGVRSVRGRDLGPLLPQADLAHLAARARDSGAVICLRQTSVTTLRDEEIEADIQLQWRTDDTWLLELHPLAPRDAATPLSASLRGLAHEVKNPLAGLRGAAQLLERRLADPDSRQLARLIIDEADRLAALTDHLLNNDGKPRLTRFNVHEVLDRLLALLRADAKAPRLNEDFDPSLPPLYADAARLQQALLNLLRNAIEAGATTLALRTRAEHGVRVGARMRRLALRVDVVDNGPGVPLALRDTLFQPMVSGRAGGSGLGLALAREIAHEHGGELRYSSRSGNTVFSLYLPLESAP
ncbi:MAG TPA: ATP-binding protein [Rhodanobacteraceae bacterium]|nr:ATP-binding protein [Rhodanobacteraceae bacterium]